MFTSSQGAQFGSADRLEAAPIRAGLQDQDFAKISTILTESPLCMLAATSLQPETFTRFPGSVNPLIYEKQLSKVR